jgi:hypothetical protein
MNTSLRGGCVLLLVCLALFKGLVLFNAIVLVFPLFFLFGWIGLQEHHHVARITIIALSFLLAFPEFYYLDKIITKWRSGKHHRNTGQSPRPGQPEKDLPSGGGV